MAIPWIAALKVIPWTEVLQAAPGIVKGARRLFASKKDDLAHQPVVAPTTETFPPGVDKMVHLGDRIGQIQAQVVELSKEQKSSAELIRSLAEQNARVVEAIEVLRIRTRMFFLAAIVLAGALVALAAWVATK